MASKASLDVGEKAKVAGSKDAETARAKHHQNHCSEGNEAVGGNANTGTNGASAAAPARPLRRLQEGEAFILDINAGDRQCLMYARSSR